MKKVEKFCEGVVQKCWGDVLWRSVVVKCCG